MKEYDILNSVVLAFLSAQDHYDAILTSADGHIGFDGRNIIFIGKDGEQAETITTNNAIGIWLEQGRIKAREQ